MKKLLLISITSMMLFACSKKEITTNIVENQAASSPDTVRVKSGILTPTIKQGFYGFVVEWKGDFMPGPKCCTGTIDSVQKEIYIYNKITFDSIQHARTDQYSMFWNLNKIKQKPIKIVKTNNLGFYEVELSPGNYSGLVKYNKNTFFNNGGSSDGQLGKMLVLKTTLLQRNFDIDFEKTE